MITGRLLSVERKTRVSGGTTLEVDLATVVSDAAKCAPSKSRRSKRADRRHESEGEVGRYLSLLASTHQQDLRRMTISAAGTGERADIRELYQRSADLEDDVSNRAAVKGGRTTAAARLGDCRQHDRRGLEQRGAFAGCGSAAIFHQQLSQPYYARRPVVPLPETAELTPQTHEERDAGRAWEFVRRRDDHSGAVVQKRKCRSLTRGREHRKHTRQTIKDNTSSMTCLRELRSSNSRRMVFSTK